MHRCAWGLWLQGHTARASLLCSVLQNISLCALLISRPSYIHMKIFIIRSIIFLHVTNLRMMTLSQNTVNIIHKRGGWYTAVHEGCGYKDTLRAHRYFVPSAKYFTVCITYQPPLLHTYEDIYNSFHYFLTCYNLTTFYLAVIFTTFYPAVMYILQQ